MNISPADIKLILATLQESEFDQAEVAIGDVRIVVARNGHSLDAAPRAVAPQAAAPGEEVAAPVTRTAPATPAPSGSANTVESPSVGVFWRAPSPGAAPFVEIGREVAAGDTIGIVEVMKLMTNIAAGVDGVVTAIHVDNAGAVQFGTPLVTIEPKA